MVQIYENEYFRYHSISKVVPIDIYLLIMICHGAGEAIAYFIKGNII